MVPLSVGTLPTNDKNLQRMHLSKATSVTLSSSTFKKVKKERRSHADPDTRRPLAAPYQYLGNAHEHAAICNLSTVVE